MKFYKEKTSNRDFSKTGNQNFLIFAYVVGNYLNFWNFGVPIPVTFLNLDNPSHTVWRAMGPTRVTRSVKNSHYPDGGFLEHLGPIILLLFNELIRHGILVFCSISCARCTFADHHYCLDDNLRVKKYKGNFSIRFF